MGLCFTENLHKFCYNCGYVSIFLSNGKEGFHCYKHDRRVAYWNTCKDWNPFPCKETRGLAESLNNFTMKRYEDENECSQLKTLQPIPEPSWWLPDSLLAKAPNRINNNQGENIMKNTLVVNLFGQPGAGKSTGAAYIFAMLKLAGVDCEMVTEYAKDLVWDKSVEQFNNQAHIFGEQSYRLTRLKGKVDVVITDSPIPLSILFNCDKNVYTANFEKSVMDVFNSFRNVNFLIKRVKPYNPNGRFQTEEESDALKHSIENMLSEQGIAYSSVNGDEEGYKSIIRNVLNVIEKSEE